MILLQQYLNPLLCLCVSLQAAMGIAELITMAMEKEGLAKDESLKKIWMVDSKGLIVKVSYCSTSSSRHKTYLIWDCWRIEEWVLQ